MEFFDIVEHYVFKCTTWVLIGCKHIHILSVVLDLKYLGHGPHDTWGAIHLSTNLTFKLKIAPNIKELFS